ncbi:hypothetical protein BDV34DRAFT_195392 [Aspergillus parasiticus]|uniref:Uncharacterized protein n=1 Tax=Aspergillus parasiticus TaxID=5067 RepID=A0A5N6DKM2_ASPPA|nr:hypothetical protein BDV34DRAFT_195392 [Aspergillus parasiticus]
MSSGSLDSRRYAGCIQTLLPLDSGDWRSTKGNQSTLVQYALPCPRNCQRPSGCKDRRYLIAMSEANGVHFASSGAICLFLIAPWK